MTSRLSTDAVSGATIVVSDDVHKEMAEQGAVVAHLASARLSEQEVSGSIFSDFNICFDLPLI